MATLVDIKNLAIAYGKAPPVLAGFTAGLERGSYGRRRSFGRRQIHPAARAGRPDGARDRHRGHAHAARMGRPVALVFQEARLLPWRRVLENVSFGLEGTGLSKADRTARARETLDLVGLAEMASRWPHQLSGGQRQRINLARAPTPRSAAAGRAVLRTRRHHPADAPRRIAAAVARDADDDAVRDARP